MRKLKRYLLRRRMLTQVLSLVSIILYICGVAAISVSPFDVFEKFAALIGVIYLIKTIINAK